MKPVENFVLILPDEQPNNFHALPADARQMLLLINERGNKDQWGASVRRSFRARFGKKKDRVDTLFLYAHHWAVRGMPITIWCSLETNRFIRLLADFLSTDHHE